MDTGSRTYEFELWSSGGTSVMDISEFISNRQITFERNEAEVFTFTLDIYEFQRRCAAVGLNPRTVLRRYQTDLKIKRNGQYWRGAQIVGLVTQLSGTSTENTSSQNGPSSFNPTISVTATGYLNLFKDRYITKTYTSQERIDIACDMITTTQAQTNGDVGVTLDATQHDTGITDTDRTYTRDNIKTALQNLTTLVDGRFDFGFSYDKKFRTYSQIGSPRTDLKITVGGEASNIAGLYDEDTGNSLFNRIIGLGSGFGVDQLVSTQNDSASQVSNYLRETIEQYNSVQAQDTLDKNAAADLAQFKDGIAIPQITITGNEVRGLSSFLSEGDRIPLDFTPHAFLSDRSGTYRIEKMVIDLDDQDFEKSIRLYFDNYAVLG